MVATVLTACGIETEEEKEDAQDDKQLQQYLPLAVLKLNTFIYGSTLELQQYLPLAVLKHAISDVEMDDTHKLQQYLPLAVLKQIFQSLFYFLLLRCNSTYRLRY